MRFLDPRTDFAFTRIFGNDQAHDVLIHFLNSLLYFIKEAGHFENIPKRLELGPYRHAFEIANLAGMSKQELDAFEAASIVLQDEKGALEAALNKGRSQGKIEGLKEAIKLGLELKYGVEGLKLLERINNITLLEKFEALKETVKISKSMEEIEKLL